MGTFVIEKVRQTRKLEKSEGLILDQTSHDGCRLPNPLQKPISISYFLVISKCVSGVDDPHVAEAVRDDNLGSDWQLSVDQLGTHHCSCSTIGQLSLISDMSPVTVPTVPAAIYSNSAIASSQCQKSNFSINLEYVEVTTQRWIFLKLEKVLNIISI